MAPFLLLPIPPVTVVQVMDVTFCSISFRKAPSHLVFGFPILRFVLGVMLLMLAVISTLKQSVAMYKATKQWQPNHYMQHLVKDGSLYFLAYVVHLTLKYLQTN